MKRHEVSEARRIIASVADDAHQRCDCEFRRGAVYLGLDGELVCYWCAPEPRRLGPVAEAWEQMDRQLLAAELVAGGVAPPYDGEERAALRDRLRRKAHAWLSRAARMALLALLAGCDAQPKPCRDEAYSLGSNWAGRKSATCSHPDQVATVEQGILVCRCTGPRAP